MTQRVRLSLSTLIITYFIVTFTFLSIDWKISSTILSKNNEWKIFCLIVFETTFSFDILSNTINYKNKFYELTIWKFDILHWKIVSKNVILSFCWNYKLRNIRWRMLVTIKYLAFICKTYYVIFDQLISLIFLIKY